ncbi:hypothetical protein IP88_06580 [alpha proteobacterium AAP81b]|nr:hypothetical protein IP88_06580 [alpha proteobacterium AAP81b]
MTESSDPPPRTLHFKIAMAARALRYSFDGRAADSGMTSAQWRTVAVVAAAQGSTQRHIARLLGVGDVTAGRMIDRLCEDGVLERRPDPADRRANRIHLTAKAEPLLEQLHLLAAKEEARAFAGLDDDAKAALHGHLDIILGNLRGALD